MEICGKFKPPGLQVLRRPFMIMGDGSLEAGDDGLLVKGQKPQTVQFSFTAALSAFVVAAASTWLFWGSLRFLQTIVPTIAAGFGVGMAICNRDRSLNILIPWKYVNQISARGRLLRIKIRRFRPSGDIRFTPNGNNDVMRYAEALQHARNTAQSQLQEV